MNDKTTEISTDPLLRLDEVRRLGDGRLIVSTVGGSYFALSLEDWRTAAKGIEKLAADHELEAVYVEDGE